MDGLLDHEDGEAGSSSSSSIVTSVILAMVAKNKKKTEIRFLKKLQFVSCAIQLSRNQTQNKYSRVNLTQQLF